MATRKAFAITAFEDRLSRFFSDRPGLCRFLGNLETRRFLPKIGSQKIDRPIYVSGLARCGSTLLLECLAAHEHTASHSYRDYPLISCPLWWNRFVDRAAGSLPEPVERFHKDRIFITPDSPETMEEMLWMMFFPDCHQPLQSHVIGAETEFPAFEKFYRDHIRKILFLRQGSRYLAKANYHVTRLNYLHKLFPDTRFVVPVRNPVHHIGSLWRQQKHFCDREQADTRVLNYMRRSGHFEFGFDRRPINTGNIEVVQQIMRLWEQGAEGRGWALAWRSIYSFLADRLTDGSALRKATLVVSYEDLCRLPKTVLGQLYDHCGLTVSDELVDRQARRISPPDYYQLPFPAKEAAVIREETEDTYQRMLALTPQV